MKTSDRNHLAQEVLVICAVADTTDQVVSNLVCSPLPRYSLTIVNDLCAATVLLAARRFAVIFYDFSARDAAGGSPISILRAAAPTAAILALVAVAEDQALIAAAMRQGAQDYVLAVDLSPARLARLVRSAIERQEHKSAEANRMRDATSTLDCIGDAVLITDVEGRVNYLNPVAEILTGWARNEALGTPTVEVLNLIDERTRRATANPLLPAIQENRTVDLIANYVLLSKDGREYLIEDSAAPIHSKNGELTGAVIVFRDVSRL